MFLTKLRTTAAVLLAVGLLGAGTGWLAPQALADKPKQAGNDAGQKDRKEVRGVVKAVDASHNTIRVQRGKGFPGEETLTLAAGAQVLLDDGTGDKLGSREGQLADLAEGIRVTLRLSPDQKVTRIWVEGPTLQGVLKAVDTVNHRLTATVALTKAEPATDQTFAVARNARLFLDDGQGKDKSQPSKPTSLSDLPVNVVVSLQLSADRKVVGSIRAEGQRVTGRLKAVDGARNAITITISAKGEPDVDRTFPVAKTAQVSLADGKPKDKAKPAESPRLADLPAGAQVTLRLSLDGQSVVAIQAEGTNVHGTVKAVDPAKRTLTLHDKARAEKTYNVSMDAEVFLDGKGDGKTLADVPMGAVVDLKLRVDQKTVHEIRATGPTVTGRVVGNADKDSVTVRDKQGEKTFTVAEDTPILLDSGREGRLTDLIEGTVARLRLAVDNATVRELHAEGPSFHGKVKWFDPDRNIVTVTVGSKNNVEDKEFQLTKATVVRTEINGIPLKPTDLRADKEVVLRLSIDQKAAARITVLGE